MGELTVACGLASGRKRLPLQRFQPILRRPHQFLGQMIERALDLAHAFGPFVRR